ncbi:MAG: hypothetical protein GEU82_08080 [Luteitalea sp.]|nr:hypothetical protein [Luteitalea sp.]
MIELALPAFGRARVWLDEHPDIAVEGTRLVTRTLPARQGVSTIRRAGVELFVPSGALAGYALVCGRFVPNDRDTLALELPVGGTPADRLSWSLAADLDDVRPGLPDEYAESVLAALMAAPDVLGSGTLTLGPTAHAHVGSSPSVFFRASAALLDILAMNPEDISGEQVVRILQSRRG